MTGKAADLMASDSDDDTLAETVVHSPKNVKAFRRKHPKSLSSPLRKSQQKGLSCGSCAKSNEVFVLQNKVCEFLEICHLVFHPKIILETNCTSPDFAISESPYHTFLHTCKQTSHTIISQNYVFVGRRILVYQRILQEPSPFPSSTSSLG